MCVRARARVYICVSSCVTRCAYNTTAPNQFKLQGSPLPSLAMGTARTALGMPTAAIVNRRTSVHHLTQTLDGQRASKVAPATRAALRIITSTIVEKVTAGITSATKVPAPPRGIAFGKKVQQPARWCGRQQAATLPTSAHEKYRFVPPSVGYTFMYIPEYYISRVHKPPSIHLEQRNNGYPVTQQYKWVLSLPSAACAHSRI